MGKDKLRKFEAVNNFSHVFEPVIGEESNLKGSWAAYFGNKNPIVLELGCGKGEYSVGLGKHFPDKNFIGMDIKGARIWKGACDVLEAELKNVAFLRAKIDFITEYFAENEISEIWLTFSDPQPKKPNKRLSSPIFIDRYKKIMKPNSIIHLKTDSDLLWEYTLEQIEEKKYGLLEKYPNLYAELPSSLDATTKEILNIRTHYEKLFTAKGSVIKYCRFRVWR